MPDAPALHIVTDTYTRRDRCITHAEWEHASPAAKRKYRARLDRAIRRADVALKLPAGSARNLRLLDSFRHDHARV